ncbi:MAG: thiamine pyrophosphate-dependent enzyme [Chloroflexi bacterium]|nr:thiamine pyrophosphate-dependent enzyme [Chloroflexota bacterium]
MAKQLMSGDQAIARGVWEAGVMFATSYPGTPATEILESLSHYPEVQAQWAVNEKVAFDEAMGAAIAGVRAFVSVKHVGLNVAADSFMVFPYAGTNAGFVVLTADDPGTHSSQNEQDNRYFAKFGKVPLLEPSDTQEAKEYVKLAFQVSEQFETPTMLRITMRLAHTKGMVELGERVTAAKKPFVKDNIKWVVPPFAKLHRAPLESKMRAIEQYAETFPENRIEKGTGGVDYGVITSGVIFQYAREVLPEPDFFKLGMTFPLPKQRILDFCQAYKKVYVIEEGEPFLEEQMRYWGVQNIVGKELFTNVGELLPELIAEQMRGTKAPGDYSKEISIPARPPMLCIGCPHRGTFTSLNRIPGITVTGDIGCYTLGGLPPYNTMNTSFEMGGSIAHAFGFERAGEPKTIAIIGDSTFLHSGIAPLMDAVYNRGKTTVVIVDNRTTGMTGQENHAGTGKDIHGNPAKKIDYEALCRAMGVEFVRHANAYRPKEVEAAVRQALKFDGPAVVISEGPCVLTPEEKAKPKVAFTVVAEECIACGLCFHTGCPAILESQETYRASEHQKAKSKAIIDPIICVGCTLCAAVCPPECIVRVDGQPWGA